MRSATIQEEIVRGWCQYYIRNYAIDLLTIDHFATVPLRVLICPDWACS